MSNICYEPSSNEARLVLEGRLDIRSAGELQKKLCDAVATDLPIVINCEAAEWLDTACMQLLLATHRAAPTRVTVRVAHESTVQHWLETSGFADQMTLAH